MLKKSALRVAHEQATPLGEARKSPAPAWDRRMLFGVHTLRFPVLCLTVAPELGNCRHALSQRIVGGGMEVTLPFGDSNPFFRTPSVKKSDDGSSTPTGR